MDEVDLAAGLMEMEAELKRRARERGGNRRGSWKPAATAMNRSRDACSVRRDPAIATAAIGTNSLREFA